jgi:ubiquinone/menaquinone biosynthesis C-methylase UbiE
VSAAERGGEFAGVTCTAAAGRSERMREIVVAHVPAGRPLRVLDVGCGTGSLLFRLADSLPQASLVGIDVSGANIDAARREQAGRAPSARVQFEAADYTAYSAPPFDAIVADGVLHLVQGDTRALVRKLAADLRPGGVLVCDMPYECAYNTAFAAVRRMLRRVRTPLLDRAILQAGRLLHGREMSEEGLRERVGYMYIPPARMIGPRLLREFEAAGFRTIAAYPMISTSLSQLRHRVTVFTRASAA